MRSSNQVSLDTTVPSAVESSQAKLVYLALAAAGPATTGDLAAMLDETRLALLPVVGTLEERGLVVRRPDGYAAVGEQRATR
jgi:DNA-binding MarR family transcriptional regulator